ncbi:MAG: hypothetical protein RLN99_04405 [Kiloniellaceae bacterium]
MRAVVFVLALIVAFRFTRYEGLSQDNGVPVPVPGIEYGWQLSDSKARDLIEKIKSLRYGDKLDDVRQLLGEAAFDAELCGKKLDEECRGHALEYPIRRVRPEGGNTNDQTIHLFFDMGGRLDEIAFQSMLPLAGDVISSYVHGSGGTASYSTRPPARQPIE